VSTGHWYVLIEENAGYGSGIRWQLTYAIPATGMEHAAELARHAAFNHMPENPRMPKERAVFRTPDGSWVVNVKGPTITCHFRVSIAEHYGVFPGKPQT
jgi:hypothetical protein